nr:MAG TPA: hypothetical protein [Caudoviricetes sp.]
MEVKTKNTKHTLKYTFDYPGFVSKVLWLSLC